MDHEYHVLEYAQFEILERSCLYSRDIILIFTRLLHVNNRISMMVRCFRMKFNFIILLIFFEKKSCHYHHFCKRIR